MTAVSPVLEATIDVDAPIGRVWAVVADLSSMGRRSPQCRVSKPLGPIRPGTFVVHLNNDGWKWWPTTARITTVEPQREIAFRVLEIRLRKDGTFVSGTLDSVHIDSRGVPALDPSGAARKRIAQLSDQDFGEDAPGIAADGRITMP